MHWCINAKGIKGVSCPSKYYGISATAKSVLAVLEKETEIRCIIEQTKSGLCSDPGDYKAVEQNIRWFIEHAHTDKLAEMGKQKGSALYFLKELLEFIVQLEIITQDLKGLVTAVLEAKVLGK